MCASRAEPLWNLPEVAREGITCIVCHRVQYVYGNFLAPPERDMSFDFNQ